MSAEALGFAGKVASFRTQVSRTTLKVRLGPAQRPFAAFRFDEGVRFGFGHCLAAVLAMSTRQRRREFEANNFSFHDGGGVHAVTVSNELNGNK